MIPPLDPPPAPESPAGRVAALRTALRARAAGLWRVEGDRLAQVAFVAAADLPAEVASSFAEATQAVPFSRSNLGIVQAATTAAVAVSRVADLPAEAGSGRWLRAFEAERSVAVPLLDPSGVVAAVLSVALDAAPPGDDEVASVVRAHGLTLLPAAGPNR